MKRCGNCNAPYRGRGTRAVVLTHAGNVERRTVCPRCIARAALLVTPPKDQTDDPRLCLRCKEALASYCGPCARRVKHDDAASGVCSWCLRLASTDNEDRASLALHAEDCSWAIGLRAVHALRP